MRPIYVQLLVASNFAKNRENVKEECLDVIIFFPSLSVVLSLRDVQKTVFWVNQNEGAQAVVKGGTAPVPPFNDSTGTKIVRNSRKWR